jgi:curved DNA-binding protein CbpA
LGDLGILDGRRTKFSRFSPVVSAGDARAASRIMAPSGPGGLAEEQQVLTDLTDQALIDHFVSLTEHATVWVALKLTGADATADNAKKLWQKLMKRLHPDKCNLPEADEAFRKINHFRDKTMRLGSLRVVPARGSGTHAVDRSATAATAAAPAKKAGTNKPAAQPAAEARRASSSNAAQTVETQAHAQAQAQAQTQAQAAAKAQKDLLKLQNQQKALQARIEAAQQEADRQEADRLNRLKAMEAAAAAAATAAATATAGSTAAAPKAKPAKVRAQAPSVGRPSAPAAAASDAAKPECLACRGWKRPHSCGKAREKPGPKPRERSGCQGCLGIHMAHTCGDHGRPEARAPANPTCHVWTTRPSPELPPLGVRAQNKAKVEQPTANEELQSKRQRTTGAAPAKQPAAKSKPAAEPAAKSTGPPLGPRAKARRAATPESPHGRVATPPEITYACARTGYREAACRQAQACRRACRQVDQTTGENGDDRTAAGDGEATRQGAPRRHP